MLHVRLSTGSDGLPVGYPVECVESQSATVLPGFDVIWTPAQLQAAKEALRPQYLAAEAIRVANASIEQNVLRIRAERDRRLQQGGFQVAGKWFHSDTFSRSQQIGLVLLGANVPAGLQWKTMDGSFVPMTPQLAQQIFSAAAAQDVATFAASEQAQAALRADPVAFSFSSIAWPATFAG